jgi:hypothetical protein
MADIDALKSEVPALEAELVPLRARLETLQPDCIRAFADWLAEGIRDSAREKVNQETAVTLRLHEGGSLPSLRADVEKLAADSYNIASEALATDALWVHLEPHGYREGQYSPDTQGLRNDDEQRLPHEFDDALSWMARGYFSLMMKAGYSNAHLRLGSSAPEPIWRALASYEEAVKPFRQVWERLTAKRQELNKDVVAKAWEDAESPPTPPSADGSA